MSYLASLTPLDYTILTLLLGSTLFGLIRGIVKETILIFSWCAAFIVTTQYGQQISELILLKYYHPQTNLSPNSHFGFTIACCGILFIGILVAGNIFCACIRPLCKISGLSLTDRLFGAILGGLRGILMAIITMLLLNYTDFASTTQDYAKTHIAKYLLPVMVLSKQVVDPYVQIILPPQNTHTAPVIPSNMPPTVISPPIPPAQHG